MSLVARLAASVPGDVCLALWCGRELEPAALRRLLEAAAVLLATLPSAEVRAVVRGLALPARAAHAATVAALLVRSGACGPALAPPLVPVLAVLAAREWGYAGPALIAPALVPLPVPPAWAAQVAMDEATLRAAPPGAPVHSGAYMACVPRARLALYPHPPGSLGARLAQAARDAGVEEGPAVRAAARVEARTQQ